MIYFSENTERIFKIYFCFFSSLFSCPRVSSRFLATANPRECVSSQATRSEVRGGGRRGRSAHTRRSASPASSSSDASRSSVALAHSRKRRSTVDDA